MKITPASGKMAGEYKVELASFWSADDHSAGKNLEGILRVDNDNGWRVVFRVTKNDHAVEFDGLAAAVRRYDDDTRGKR